jgi:hypothetical protein
MRSDPSPADPVIDKLLPLLGDDDVAPVAADALGTMTPPSRAAEVVEKLLPLLDVTRAADSVVSALAKITPPDRADRVNGQITAVSDRRTSRTLRSLMSRFGNAVHCTLLRSIASMRSVHCPTTAIGCSDTEGSKCAAYRTSLGRASKPCANFTIARPVPVMMNSAVRANFVS